MDKDDQWHDADWVRIYNPPKTGVFGGPVPQAKDEKPKRGRR